MNELLNGRIKYQVTDTGCWEVTNLKTNERYHRLSVNNKKELVHRLVYMEYTGNYFDSDICVLHKCDNTKCVNPEHLFIGTQQDNVIDKVNKNRQSQGEKHGDTIRGELHGKHILTVDDVYFIRNAFKCNYKTRRELADMFGISIKTIHKIIHNQIWTHV